MSAQKQTIHSRIPEKAARWLVTQMTRNEKDRINLLGPRQGKQNAASVEEMVHSLSHDRHGISSLRVAELKYMCRLLMQCCKHFQYTRAMRPGVENDMFQAVLNYLEKFLYAAKDDIIEKLMRSFYLDFPTCEAAHTEFIDLLVTYVHSEQPGPSSQTLPVAFVPPGVSGNPGTVPLPAFPPQLPYVPVHFSIAATTPAAALPTQNLHTANGLYFRNNRKYLPNQTAPTTTPAKRFAPWHTPNRSDTATVPSQNATGASDPANHQTAITAAAVPPANTAAMPPTLSGTAGTTAQVHPAAVATHPSRMEMKKRKTMRPLAPSPMNTINDTIQLDERTDDDRFERVPQNSDEQNALSTLQQMSFTDPKEILASFRKLKRARTDSQSPSIDDIMLDIITTREEADEARKMDAARLLSEQSRKEEAKRRREGLEREFRTSLECCANVQWLMNPQDKRLYQASWVLKDATIYATLQKRITAQITTLKMELLQLLKFEKNAQKWYGSVLPQSYFRYVVNERLIQAIVLDDGDGNDPHLLLQMQKENELLQTGMFDLSEQMGGVPKLFRDAHDQYQLHVPSKDEVFVSSNDSSPVVIDLIDD